MALQRTAPGRLRVSRLLLPADPPRSSRATLRHPSAVSELESFGVRSELRPADLPKEQPMKLHHLFALTMLAAGSASAANLISDSSFESQTTTSPYQRLHTGDSIAGVWFVKQVDFDLGLVMNGYNPGGFPQPPPDGNQYVYVSDSEAHGTLLQQIGSLFGTYEFSFFQGNGNAGAGLQGEVQIQFAPIISGIGASTVFGPAIYDRTFLVPANGWFRQDDVVAIPVADNYGLIVTSLGTGREALVDNFSLSIPEPSAVSFLCVGTFAMFGRARRKPSDKPHAMRSNG